MQKNSFTLTPVLLSSNLLLSILLVKWNGRSFVWGKISNEATTKSLNVRSGASESGGRWIFLSQDWRYGVAANSTKTYIRRECVACCEWKSWYQCTEAGLCNRKISNNCPSCTAGRSFRSVSCSKSAAITVRWSPTTYRVCTLFC